MKLLSPDGKLLRMSFETSTSRVPDLSLSLSFANSSEKSIHPSRLPHSISRPNYFTSIVKSNSSSLDFSRDRYKRRREKKICVRKKERKKERNKEGRKQGERMRKQKKRRKRTDNRGVGQEKRWHTLRMQFTTTLYHHHPSISIHKRTHTEASV